MANIIDISRRPLGDHELRALEEDGGQGAPLPYAPTGNPAAAAPDERNLADVLRQLWRRRWLLILITLAGAAIAIVVAKSIPTRYTGEARVLIGVQGPRVVSADAAILAEVRPDAERVQNESLVVQSRAIAQQVAEQLHLANNPYFSDDSSWSPWQVVTWTTQRLPGVAAWLGRQGIDLDPPAKLTPEQRESRVVDRLLSRLDVAMLGRSYVLSVKADAPDPVTAANIANAFADNYLVNQRKEKVATMDRVDKYMMDRVDELRAQVRRSDQAVEDYRRANDLYKSGTGSVATQQLAELNTQLMAAQAAKIEAQARLQEAKTLGKGGAGVGSVPDVLNSPLISSLIEQLAQADRRGSEAGASLGELHPAMRSARAESASLSGRIAAEMAKIMDGLERDARTATARYNALLANFENVKAQLGTVNDKSIQLDALERDAVVSRRVLEAMLNRVKQSIGTATVVQPDAKIISPAAPPLSPSFPPKALIVVLGSFTAFLVAVSIAMLMEASDRTFRRSDQVETLTGLPVLAMVPQVRGRGVAQHVLRDPVSPFSEALRRLFVGIELSQPDSTPRVIMMSSATPAEGKSVMTASLGRQLADSGKRVLVIDCDWRSPRLHQIFQCSNAKGLANLLVEEDALLNDCLHRDELSGLHVVPSGKWAPHMPHLLGSERMAYLLRAFADEYDLVILDSAPVLVTADALALARLVEKVVFVVRWGSTRQEAVLDALKQLLEIQADVAGIAISRVVMKQFRRYASRDFSQTRPIEAAVRS